MVLATKKALESKWVSWELGVADSSKEHKRIVIIPVADASGQFHGNEYLQLYQRLEGARNGGMAVFPVQSDTGGTTLYSYLCRLAKKKTKSIWD